MADRTRPGQHGQRQRVARVGQLPRHYLRHIDYDLVLARNDSSAIFRADATFRRVAGLADASAVSFQSYNFPDRYLRHANYLLRIDPITTAAGRADATFRITG